MPTYRLVNPKIIGDFKDTINAENHINAADKLWLSLSKYITHNVPTFMITLEDQDSKKLYSATIEEKPHGNSADYTISELDLSLTPEQEKSFRKQISRIEELKDEILHKQKTGGRHREHHRHHKRHKHDNDYDNDYDNEDDSSSSSDEDSPEFSSFYKNYKIYNYLTKPKPIVYWWYTPIYYKVDRFYVPTFTPTVLPYIEINLSSAAL